MWVVRVETDVDAPYSPAELWGDYADDAIGYDLPVGARDEARRIARDLKSSCGEPWAYVAIQCDHPVAMRYAIYRRGPKAEGSPFLHDGQRCRICGDVV